MNGAGGKVPNTASAGGWRLWAVTMGGAGLLPVGPGTWGSLVASIVLGAVYYGLLRAGVSAITAWNGTAVVGLVFYSILCIQLGQWGTEHFARKDPGPYVLDEGAGICLTALLLPIYPSWRQLWVLLAVFVSFRIFDITKPPPARQLEKLPLGWGILLDDLAAAVYANVVCQVVFRSGWFAGN